MDVIKVYQLEKFEIADDNDGMMDTCEIESWDDYRSSVTIYGKDGNIMLETSGEKLMNDEYPEWAEQCLKQLHLI